MNERQAGEEGIRKLRDENPRTFMATLTREIAQEDRPVGSRQMAAIIFKNFITNRNKDPKYENYWVNLETSLREQMKEAILSVLASPQNLVRG